MPTWGVSLSSALGLSDAEEVGACAVLGPGLRRRWHIVVGLGELLLARHGPSPPIREPPVWHDRSHDKLGEDDIAPLVPLDLLTPSLEGDVEGEGDFAIPDAGDDVFAPQHHIIRLSEDLRNELL
eukprot:CAMPEP_0180162912 /NCGR_PEP_ID=MMETSP0986-20121125/29494_1 /TAXON_ID=697907 /ORGANISM="non described non described, Strain CCMP2293" /LENGTH=124 /DNA_ID=CAMNT_0022113463 /DNA_START=341 /DNA_END=712 /DNA_ORIENTATION=+